MGVILRQGFKHTIIRLISTLVGMVNVLFLFTAFLSKEEFGLYQYLINTSLFIATFVSFGFTSVGIYFFSQFREQSEKNNGFLFFLLLIPTLVFLVFASICFLFQDSIYASYATHPDADLLFKYLKFTLILIFLIAIINVLTSYISNFKLIVVPEILNNLLLKVTIPIFATAYYFSYISFPYFIYGLVGCYFLSKLGLLIYLWYLGELNLKPNLTYLNKSTVKNISSYAFYTVLSGLGTFIATKIDIFMVGTLIDMQNTAIFTVALFISTVIGIPLQSIFKITSPIIASSFRTNDLEQINDLYKKTSLNLLIIGMLLTIGIWASIDYLFELIPNGTTYAVGKNIIFLLSIAKLVDMATGLNAHIIVYSKLYKLNFYFSLLLAILNIVLNLVLIPQYQIFGVALATFFSIVFFNLLKVGVVWKKLNMHPFSWNMLWVLLVGAVVYLSVFMLPVSNYPLLNIIFTSFYIGLVYLSSILLFKLSDDAHTIKEKIFTELVSFFQKRRN